MKTIKIAFEQILLVTSISIILTSCSNIEDMDEMKVEAFSEKAAMQLMEKTFAETGKNPSGSVLNWSLDETQNKYKIKMLATWTGSINKLFALLGVECKIQVIGDLIVDRDGGRPTFKKTTVVSLCGTMSELDSLQTLENFYPKGYLLGDK